MERAFIKKNNALIIKKICAILLLIALFFNTNFLTIISLAVEETENQEQTAIDAKEKISMNLDYNQFTNKYQNEVIITGVLETDTEESKLFENPTIYFELPAEVEKVIIDDVKLLYEDELTLGEYVVETNENGNQQIKVSLNGKQTKYQLDGIVKGANIRIVANIILKQDIESKITNIIMKCGEATYNQEIQVVNSTEIKTIEKVDETEGTKNYADGIIVETKAIRGDKVLNNDDVIYENEIIKYEVKITNTSNKKIDDIKIIANIPDFLEYVPMEQGEFGYGYNSDSELKKYEIDVDTLTAGETKEYYFELQAIEGLDTRELHDRVMTTYLAEMGERVTGTEGYDSLKDAEKWELRRKVLREITLEEKPNATEEEITEAIEYVIDKLYNQYAGESVDKNVNPNYMENIEVSIDTLVDDEIINTYKITHNLKLSEINAVLTSRESGATRNEWKYLLNLYRVNDLKGLEELDPMNATVTIKLPEFFEIESVYSSEEENIEYQKSEDGLLTIPVEGMGEVYQIGFTTKAVNSLEDIDNYSYKVRVSANVTTDSGNVYKSNETIAEGSREAVKITQSSEKNGETLESLGELTYIYTIENVGKAQESFGGFTEVNFEDYIPNILKIEEVEYNDNEVRTIMVEEKPELTVTPVNRVWNANQLSEANQKDSNEEPRIKIKMNIKNGETITLKIKTKVKLIEEANYEEIIENKATISGEEIKTRESNIITNRIFKETGEKEVVVTPENPDLPDKPTTEPTTPDNPSKPDNPNKPEEPTNTYSVTGSAWLDENENGKFDNEEGFKEGLTVYLYNLDTQKFLQNERGTIITKRTDSNGKYQFDDVPEGRYYVLIEFDTNQYTITDYQKSGVSELTNSDFIQRIVKLPDGQKTVGITNTVSVTKNTNSIDIGLIEIKSFDLQMEQFIEKITVTNSKGTKEYTYDDKKFAKIEIHSKQFVGSKVTIQYKIRVTNVGELAGNVNEIIAQIPEKLDFQSELNTDWVKSMSYNLSNSSYKTQEIQPGESLETTLILSKTLENESAGTFKNVTKIGISENAKHISDENAENDTDSTEVLIAVSTGIKTVLGIIGGIIGVIIVLIIIYNIMNKKNKKSKTIEKSDSEKTEEKLEKDNLRKNKTKKNKKEKIKQKKKENFKDKVEKDKKKKTNKSKDIEKNTDSKKLVLVIMVLLTTLAFNIKSYAVPVYDDSDYGDKPYNNVYENTDHHFTFEHTESDGTTQNHEGVIYDPNGNYAGEYTEEFMQQMHELDNLGYIEDAPVPCPGGHGVSVSGSSSTSWNIYQDFINDDGTPKGDISISATLTITGQSTFLANVTVDDQTGAPGDTVITVTCTGGGGSGVVPAGGGTISIPCTGAEFILGATIEAVKTCNTTYTEVTSMSTSYDWVPAVHYDDIHHASPYSCTASNAVQWCHCKCYMEPVYDTVTDYDDEGNEIGSHEVQVGEQMNHDNDHIYYEFAALGLGSLGTNTSTFYVEIPITYTWEDDASFGPENFPKKIEINKTDYDTGNVLPGCIFEINGRTVASGEKIDMLFPGTYIITEIQTPHGYTQEIGNTYEVTISPNDTLITVTATNKKNTGNLMFKKIDTVTKEPLSGVVVEILDLLPDDKHGSNGVVRYTTDQNGEVRVYDLLLDKDTEERTFYIREVYNPANGYVVDDADYGKLIDSNGTELKPINHPDYGVVYPVTIKRQVSNETGKILAEVTDKSTGQPIQGLALEVFGLMREDSSTTNGGVTYTTEVVVDSVTYTTNVNGQIIIPDFLYDTDKTVYIKNNENKDIVLKDVNGNVIGEVDNQTYGNVYPVIVKATDPNEEQIGSNIFQSNWYTIENEIKYSKVSGSVWNDGLYNNYNSQKEDFEQSLPKIKVYLHDPVNNVVHETWTDDNGNYVFGVRTDKTYDFGTTPGSDDANYKDTHVLLRRASEYWVEFEYNGVKFRNVDLNADPKLYDVSKASEEISSGNSDEDATQRIQLNERFSIIDAKDQINGNGESTGKVIDPAGTEYPDQISYQSEEQHRSSIQYGKNMQTPEGNPEAYGEDIYHIKATTYKNYDFKTYYDPIRNTTGYSDEIKAVNLGLYLREQVDLEIESDLARIDLNVNGYNHTYQYGTLIKQSDDTNLEERFQNIKNMYYQRMTHASSIVYSANNGTTGENGDVYADVTYKIYLENNSDTLKSKMNEITVNYNSELEAISYNFEGEPAVQTADGTNINGTMKELILNLNNLPNKTINNKSQEVLEVTFRAKADVMARILQDEVVLNLNGESYTGLKFDFMAEIKSYSTYSNNEEKLQGRNDTTLYEYASIDQDSAPRNAQVEIDDQNRFITDTFEDDTTIAPTIVFTTGSQTSISGTVFEDKPEEEKLAENERLGNGIYDEEESVMSNVKVELLLVPVDANQMYDSTMARDNVTSKHNYELAKLYKTDNNGSVSIEDAVTWTDENGNYTFEGVVADNYVIRYTYGENISGEGKNTYIYNKGVQVKVDPIKAREYKSTIIISDYIRKAINTADDGIPHLNGDWADGNTDKSWFLNDNLGTRYSDGVDDVEYRAYHEQSARLNNENVNDSSKYSYSEMEAYTPYIRLGVEQLNDQNIDSTLESQENGITDYEYKLQNIDFGLIERPIVNLQVNKQTTNLELTLGNGQVLIKGDPSDPDSDIPYVRPGIEDFVPIEMDSELINGSTIKQEYTISITNDSELDYPIYQITSDTDVANERNYYYYGEKGTMPATVRIGMLGDYLTPDIDVDLDELRRGGWEIVELKDLTEHKVMEATGEKTYRLITEDVEKALEDGKYILFTSDSFSDPNDSLVAIGETKAIKYDVSKVLSAEDDMKYTNDVEILEYIGYTQNKDKTENTYNRVNDTTPGNLIPEHAKETDEDSVRTTITPPTGIIISSIIYITTIGTGLIILVLGVIFIKKRVLKK